MSKNDTLDDLSIKLSMKFDFDMKKVANLLHKGYGRNSLYKVMRQLKILDNNNVPYQRFITKEYFKMAHKYRTGQPYIYDTVTLVTYKGFKFLQAVIPQKSKLFSDNLKNNIL